MQLTFQVPDEVAPRLITALCEQFDYDARKLEGESQPEFAKRMVREWLKSQVRAHEGIVAEQAIIQSALTARAQAEQKVDAEMVIT